MPMAIETLEYILIPLLIFVAVICIGVAIIRAGSSRRRRIRERLAEAPTGASYSQLIGDDPNGAANDQRHPLGWLAAIGALFAGRSSYPKLRQNLALAGIYGRSSAAVFLGGKMVMFLVGFFSAAAMAGFWMTPWILKGPIALLVWYLCWLLPDMIVGYYRQRRYQEIYHHLPDAVDLLEICVGSGMGMDTAWNAVADEVRPVSAGMADEMVLTNLEIHLGATRADAMRNMSQRTNVDELTSLVAVLVQSERFGASVTDALRAFASNLREVRSQRAEERAEKMAVKLLFPMILFILPAVFIVTVGAAVMKILHVFDGGSL